MGDIRIVGQSAPRLVSMGKEDKELVKINIITPLIIFILSMYLLTTKELVVWVWVIFVIGGIFSFCWLVVEIVHYLLLYSERLGTISSGEKYNLHASEVDVMLRSDGQKPLTKSELKNYRNGMFS